MVHVIRKTTADIEISQKGFYETAYCSVMTSFMNSPLANASTKPKDPFSKNLDDDEGDENNPHPLHLFNHLSSQLVSS